MANSNIPRGLIPVGNVAGRPNSGSIRHFATATGDSTAIFIGDPVKLTGTSQFIGGATYANVQAAASGDVMVGVVVGVKLVTRDSTIYREASTQRILLVDVDPDTLYEIQDVNSGTALTANDIGLNANLAAGSGGSTVTGYSSFTLDNTTEATTNTLDVKIIGMVNRPDNDPGSAVGTGALAAKFLVRLNRHQYANQIAGV